MDYTYNRSSKDQDSTFEPDFEGKEGKDTGRGQNHARKLRKEVETSRYLSKTDKSLILGKIRSGNLDEARTLFLEACEY